MIPVKTIFIIIGGMADLPEKGTGGKTPLMLASTPSLDALAKCGCCGSLLTVPDDVPLSTETAVLSLLGYDFARGIPSRETLVNAGRGFPTGEPLRYFVIPKYSGHGVVITASDSVRGIGKMAMLRPLFPMGSSVVAGFATGSSLEEKAKAAIAAIEFYDFVLVYVELPHEMSVQGDEDGKIEALERIDRDLISPVADYVWSAKMQMNLVVTGDHITSWRTRRCERGEVPAVVYFNDDLPYDTDTFNEESVSDGPLNAPLPGDLIRRLISFEPLPPEQ